MRDRQGDAMTGIPRIGATAPDFCVHDQDAQDVCLKDYSGKWVVLYFYPKDDTPGCTKEACQFSEELAEFRGMDAEVIGVSPDSIGSHERFIVKHALKIQLLSDTKREVLKAYGAWREKTAFGKTAPGVVRSTFLIDPEGKIVHVWPNVKVKGHVDEVKSVLSEKRRA